MTGPGRREPEGAGERSRSRASGRAEARSKGRSEGPEVPEEAGGEPWGDDPAAHPGWDGSDPEDLAGAADLAADPADAPDAEGSEVPSDVTDVGDAAEPDAPGALDAARRERDDYLDALRHLQADFENYRKRVAKQQLEMTERAAERLVDKLLPVLDTVDLAFNHGGGEEVKQIWTALLESLEREGLERIDRSGGPFDPNLHDAVAHEPGEGAQEVAEVLRAGYRWKGRVLRPAMVKVRG